MSSTQDYAGYLGGKQYGHPGNGVGVNAAQLDPEFARRMSALMQAAEAATGDKVSIFEGYRDPKRSAQLYANYKNIPVTWDGVTYQPSGKGYKAASPGNSEHNYGMAVDIRAGSNPDKFPSGPAFDYMVQHAADYGLHWFGSSDPAHFEIPQSEFKTFKGGTALAPFAIPNAPDTAALPPLPRPRPDTPAGLDPMVARAMAGPQIGTPPGTQLNLSNSLAPTPFPRPLSLTTPPILPSSSTGEMYRVGDTIPSADGSYKLLVQDDGTGHAKFVRQMNPGEVPGVFDPYKAVGANAQPSLIGNYINSHPEIAGPLQMAKGMGLTADQAAQLAANPPKFTLPSFAPGKPFPNSSGSPDDRNNAGLMQSAASTANKLGDAFKQVSANPSATLGGLTNLIPDWMKGNSGQPPTALPTSRSSPSSAQIAAIRAVPQNSYQPPVAPQMPQITAAQRSAISAVPPSSYYPATPPPSITPSPVYQPNMLGRGLPSSPYMPPVMLPNDAAALGISIPSLPQAMAPITQPQGPVSRRPVNSAPQYIPPPMATIATGKRVPVGTVTPHGGVVQSNGSINHGSWSTPGPGQDLKWWQANSMGYTV